MATVSKQVNIQSQGVYTVELNILPDGKTVTPVNDIQTWLHCAGIWDKNYTTLDEVLADSTTLLALISSNNAVDYMVRSTDWATNPGLVPIMTSNTTPSGEVIYGSYRSDTQLPYYAFNGDSNNQWVAEERTLDESKVFIGYKFTSPTKVKALDLRIAPSTSYSGWNTSGTFNVLASNDNNTWVSLETGLTWEYPNNQMQHFVISNDNDYLYYKLVFTSYMWSGSTPGLQAVNIQFYAFDKPITKDSTAMGYIGNNDYAADTLLADATWCEAICNSEYFESVLNVKVPTMTSNTTPSGEVFSNPSSTTAYKAFDGTAAMTSISISGGYNVEVGYVFPNKVKIFKAIIGNIDKTSNSYDIKDFKIRVSDDGTNWTDVFSGNHANNGDTKIYTFFNSVNAKYRCELYRVSAYNSRTYFGLGTLQFYGRA